MSIYIHTHTRCCTRIQGLTLLEALWWSTSRAHKLWGQYSRWKWLDLWWQGSLQDFFLYFFFSHLILSIYLSCLSSIYLLFIVYLLTDWCAAIELGFSLKMCLYPPWMERAPTAREGHAEGCPCVSGSWTGLPWDAEETETAQAALGTGEETPVPLWQLQNHREVSPRFPEKPVEWSFAVTPLKGVPSQPPRKPGSEREGPSGKAESCPVAKPLPAHMALPVRPPPISVLLHLADQGRDRKRTRFWKRRRPTAHRSSELSGAKP